MTEGIGVFICDCKGLVSDHIDTERLAAAAKDLDGVTLVERTGFLCGEQELAACVARLRDAGCDRLLFAGCSPRSSLKFPEERLARVMTASGLCPELFEVANIREQCAWQHEDRDAAAVKAIDLVRMAHARLALDEPAPPQTEIPKTALVVGAGPAGLQAAKDLAAAGIEVTLVDRQAWLGGRLCQLHRLFQSEAWPSVCDSCCVGPVQAKGAVLADGIRVLTESEVTEVSRANGAFGVTICSAPEFVDADRCIACHLCAEACPEETTRSFNNGASQRKAIDKEFERGVPETYNLIREACTMCGDCVPVCPTNAIDLTAEARETTDSFGAVFLATGADPLDLSGYPEYLLSHPNVITSSELEHLMDTELVKPSDGEEPEQIVFIQCAGSRAGPEKQTGGVEYCSKTCCSVTAKQVDRLTTGYPMIEPTVVYYRDLRTYERALEGLYQKLRAVGIEFHNGEVTGISAEGEEGKLAVAVEPLCDGDDEERPAINLEADLVVLAAAQTPSAGARELQEKFGVVADRHGYPVENQPRLFRPTESLVRRVFVIGSSGGPKVVQHASEQGSAAAMRAMPSLITGRAEAPRYASRINPERCTGCRTCETVCPHGAIQMTAEGAVSDPAFCQACGFCAAACPVHAADLTNFTDEQILAQTEVAFNEMSGEGPRLLALLCYWCAYSAADFAGIKRVQTPPNHRVVRIRCSSSVNTGLLMRMFQLGVDGILVAGCPEKSCHHLWGNFVADKRVELTRAVMGQLGLTQSRLRFEYIGAPAYDRLLEVLAAMDKQLRPLGPNPATAQEVAHA